jgi:ABC-type transport system involved in multi-copper enzyme maturation permease subunit
MSTDSPAVRDPAALHRAAAAAASNSHGNYAMDLLVSEWIKLRAVRSTWVIVALGLLASIGTTLLLNSSTARNWDHLEPAEQAAFDPLAASFGGYALLQLAMIAVGALAMSREYSSGLIRTTFTAVPARRAVFAAKVTVVASLTIGIGGIASVITFTASQAMFSSQHFGIPITAPGVLPALVANSLHLTGAALIGLALACLLRHSAGAITTCFAFLFLAPIFLQGDRGWLLRVHQSLMESALHHLTIMHADRHGPSTLGAWAVLLITPFVLLAAAAVVIDRRDV